MDSLSIDVDDFASGHDARTSALMLEAILAHVEQHLTSCALSPQTAAEALGVSKRYIHKLFRATTATFSEYVTSRRLDRIAEHLRVQAPRAEPISLLAARYGFKDISTFNRAFKSRYKMAPSLYRSRFCSVHVKRTAMLLAAVCVSGRPLAADPTESAEEASSEVRIVLNERNMELALRQLAHTFQFSVEFEQPLEDNDEPVSFPVAGDLRDVLARLLRNKSYIMKFSEYAKLEKLKVFAPRLSTSSASGNVPELGLLSPGPGAPRSPLRPS